MEIFQTIVAALIVFSAFIYILRTVFSKKEQNGCSDCCECSCSGCGREDTQSLKIKDLRKKDIE